MTDLYDPLLFTRHNRPLHALWLESQAWFCARELGRLIGRYLDEQIIRRLDADQHRVLTLLRYGEYRETMMISESGAYTVLAHHYIPENRVLRHWLTHDVVAVLRDRRDEVKAVAPHVDRLNWSGRSLALLHWQSEPWIRLRDMPQLLSEPPGRERRSASWRQTAARLLGI